MFGIPELAIIAAVIVWPLCILGGMLISNAYADERQELKLECDRAYSRMGRAETTANQLQRENDRLQRALDNLQLNVEA